MNSGKKMGRQIVAFLMILPMILCLAGCAGNGSGKTGASANVLKVNNTNASESGKRPEDTPSVGIDNRSEAVISNNTTPDSLASNNADELDENLNEASIITTTDAGTESLGVVSGENEDVDDGLTPTMRNSINMLNYMTSLTQKINEEKGNQLFLESAYNSFENLFPNSVDNKTQAQVMSLMDTIQGYRMISLKRARLEYIYEQNRAQALRQAIPNPIGLLSAVQSGSMLKVAASVLYMAVDSVSSYQAATSQADLQFIKEGWELDDAESNELHNSTKNALNYMFDMVRDYDIPGDYALNKGAIENFVSWSGKPDSQLVRKISWFETNQGTYSQFGPYWLELAKDYYNYGDYAKCLEAVKQYESISTRIFRKDIDYVTVLPMAIISAKETMGKNEYKKCAEKYCDLIRKNTEDKDWTLRYFAAQIYMDLYSLTKERSFIDKAYTIARENVVILVDEQKSLNASYLSETVKAEASKDATKREKKEVKNYNKTINEERKIALPPVSEALYLNSDLLFALAKEKDIDATEQRKIEAILHENGDAIFLTKALDDRFWFKKESDNLDANQIDVSFDAYTFTIPASCVTDRSTIVATISGNNGTATLEDWTVTNVERPKNSSDCSEFTVIYKSSAGEKYRYKAGDTITIKVTPVKETPDNHMDFTYSVVATKKMFVLDDVKYERLTK